jgi:hypothetical protein
MATRSSGRWNVEWTWGEIFYVIGPDLLMWTHEDSVNRALATAAAEASGHTNPTTVRVDDGPFKTVKVQMLALGLVEVKTATTVSNTTALFWGITAKGREVLMQLRTVKASAT